jgi:hypothetical protein
MTRFQLDLVLKPKKKDIALFVLLPFHSLKSEQTASSWSKEKEEEEANISSSKYSCQII